MTRSEVSSSEPVALLRIPEWRPAKKRGVRVLDDGVLVRLFGGLFDGDSEELLIELLGVVGDALFQHQDPRGVFFLPHVAEPKDANTYDAVVTAVGGHGKWIDPSLFGEDAGASFEALRSGDAARIEASQLHARGKLDETMQRLSEKLSTATHVPASHPGAELRNPQALIRAMQSQDSRPLLEAIQSGDPERIKLAYAELQKNLEEATRTQESGPVGEGARRRGDRREKKPKR